MYKFQNIKCKIGPLLSYLFLGLGKGSNGSISVHSSNPDFSSEIRLQPSYLHLKHYSHDARSVITRPMDRPDSIFLSSLRVLSNTDRKAFSCKIYASKQLSFIKKLELFGENFYSGDPSNDSAGYKFRKSFSCT